MPPDLADFAGQWHLARRIEDRREGRILDFSGQAVFTPEAHGLICRETGILGGPGIRPMTAARDWLWRADRGGIAVLFADGRPFHRFDPTVAAAEASHWCDPDAYRVTYDFTTWPDGWASLWRAQGPRKDYAMESRYSRR
ncbi:DUF6314 family protein [Tropicimonas sp. IMCC34043]|uniref:DUF6314 family protein n=1 Tax=Tropicimonas sp. IMCC34043 TaxID=2248760 RepID=UPI000E27A20D|nr:DUF6314 family protein [Tropicimonas sp. IMCC34043]